MDPDVARSACIASFYDAALDPARLEPALTRLADLAGAGAAFVNVTDPRAGRLLRYAATRLDPASLADYQTHWYAEDVRMPPSYPRPAGEFMTDESLLDRSAYRGSGIYAAVLVPNGIEHMAAMWLEKRADRVAGVSILRSARVGPYARAELERLAPAMPHVKRALTLLDRLEALRGRTRAVADVLGPRVAAFWLDAAGHVCRATAAGETLLSHGDALALRDGRLRARGAAFDAALHALVAGAVAGAHPPPSLLPRAGGPPLELLAFAVGAHSPWDPDGGARAVLIVRDPLHDPSIDALALARLLGLTAAEARVCAALAAGRSLAEAAEALRIRPSTARSHLKAALRKTGSRSQAELVRRLLVGPARLLA